ncbi:MAG: NAD(P)/FAD-dependent oxidoreductase [Nitrospinota bacterium]|nr:MAG: NAD(P)/FAD-dependent oxidoreductase [Nitrospinota bacterium]
MSRKRHVIVGGGTAGINAITTIREYDRGDAEIVLVAAERPYARMTLPYYLERSISESHLFTATPPRLAQLGVHAYLGRRATRLDPQVNTLTLDDGTTITYDNLLIATGSSPVKVPVPGAESPGVHSFWTLEQAHQVMAGSKEGAHVTMVGAGFIAFTILDALLSLGVKLTVVEIAPQILPRMIDPEGAQVVEEWLKKHGVEIRTGVHLSAIEEEDEKKRLRFQDSEDIVTDLVIMATGIRPNLEWLEGSGIQVNHGIVVDHYLRSNIPNVYAAGDVAEGPDLISGGRAVHAIEPTAMEHGRVAGANMAGQQVAYRGSLLMNIVGVQNLEIASFGAWNTPDAETFSTLKAERPAYRKLVWDGDRLIGAILLGRANDIWTTNDIGMVKGLVQSGVRLGRWKEYLRHNPFDLKSAFVASRTTAQLLSRTLLGRPSIPAHRVRAVRS